MAKRAPKLTGAKLPRLHTPWVGGKSRVDEIAALADAIGQPLLGWQKTILKDMCSVDKQKT